MIMEYTDVDSYLGPTLRAHGFMLYAVEPNLRWRDAPAWAVYYRSAKCKLQVCRADREGGIAMLMAPLDADDMFGFDPKAIPWFNSPRSLDRSEDHLGDPPPYEADEQAQWEWRRKVLEAHLGAACNALSEGAPAS